LLKVVVDLKRIDMGLAEYRKKRSFKETPEPAGGKAAGGKLTFVIQKHAASRLHYDFRLELNGVLKSWAVPKGPSLNPADKRLAMLVEDHPYDYGAFEGIIPEGNYGAGTVIIWDNGTYAPLAPATTKAEQEKLLTKQFEAGSMKFTLNGKKLKGEFALVRMKSRQENAWLLIKHRDEYISNDDVTENDRSVISGKNIEALSSGTGTKERKGNRVTAKTSPVKKKAALPVKVKKTVTVKRAQKLKAVTSAARSTSKKDNP
jgi:bifunctional non-homologous end joining protein LigD